MDEIIRIIEAGIECDKKKAEAYLKLLIGRMRKAKIDDKQIKICRERLNGGYKDGIKNKA